MADPDVKIGVDPRCGENTVGGRHFRGCCDGFAGGKCAEVRIALHQAVKLAKKLTPVAGVIFPGVLSVEKQTNRDRRYTRSALCEVAQAAMEIDGGSTRIHAAINEPD